MAARSNPAGETRRLWPGSADCTGVDFLQPYRACPQSCPLDRASCARAFLIRVACPLRRTRCRCFRISPLAKLQCRGRLDRIPRPSDTGTRRQKWPGSCVWITLWESDGIAGDIGRHRGAALSIYAGSRALIFHSKSVVHGAEMPACRSPHIVWMELWKSCSRMAPSRCGSGSSSICLENVQSRAPSGPPE